MLHHKIKILPIHYDRVSKGTKTFEIRVNDRAYQKGDLVTLRPYSETTKDYIYPETSKHNLTFKIGDVYSVDPERVVFSLLKIVDEI